METSESIILDIINAYQVIEYRMKADCKDINDLRQDEILELILQELD